MLKQPFDKDFFAAYSTAREDFLKYSIAHIHTLFFSCIGTDGYSRIRETGHKTSRARASKDFCPRYEAFL